jgi:hypothetical protein
MIAWDRQAVDRLCREARNRENVRAVKIRDVSRNDTEKFSRASLSTRVVVHKSVTPVCLPYVRKFPFVTPRARKLRKLFPRIHATTASCIFGAPYGHDDGTKFAVFTGCESDRRLVRYRWPDTKKFLVPSRGRLKIYWFLAGPASRL